MRLIKFAFIGALGVTLIVPAVCHATEGSDMQAGVSPPASPPPPQQRPADAPEQIGRSFRQVGDSVEKGAKTIGHVVEDGARQVGRSIDEGWRSFKRGLSGD